MVLDFGGIGGTSNASGIGLDIDYNADALGTSAWGAECNKERTCNSVAYVKLKELRISTTGTNVSVHFYWEGYCIAEWNVYTRLYVNGVAAGGEWNNHDETVINEILTNLNDGDKIQIYGRNQGNPAALLHVLNFKIISLIPSQIGAGIMTSRINQTEIFPQAIRISAIDLDNGVTYDSSFP